MLIASANPSGKDSFAVVPLFARIAFATFFRSMLVVRYSTTVVSYCRVALDSSHDRNRSTCASENVTVL